MRTFPRSDLACDSSRPQEEYNKPKPEMLFQIGKGAMQENKSSLGRKKLKITFAPLKISDYSWSWSRAFYGRESPAWRARGKWPLLPELFPSICLYHFSISVTNTEEKRTHVLLSRGPQETGNIFLPLLGGQKTTHTHFTSQRKLTERHECCSDSSCIYSYIYRRLWYIQPSHDRVFLSNSPAVLELTL